MPQIKSFLGLSAASMLVLGSQAALASGEVELLYGEVTTWKSWIPAPATTTQSAFGFADDEIAGVALGDMTFDLSGGTSDGVPYLHTYRYYLEVAITDPLNAGTVSAQLATSAGTANCTVKFATVRGDGRGLYTAICASDVASGLSYVRRDVDGATYWDDNGGLGHALSFAEGPRMPAGGVFHHAVPRRSGTTGMFGAVALESLPADATVAVVYSKDNWASAWKAPATVSNKSFAYCMVSNCTGKNPSTDGTTVHTFTLPDVTPKIRYYLVVESSVGSFTDDNDGEDYVFAP